MMHKYHLWKQQNKCFELIFVPGITKLNEYFISTDLGVYKEIGDFLLHDTSLNVENL